MLGASIEYYDIALYGYMAPILVHVFLPDFPKTTAYFVYFLFEFFAALCQVMGARFYGKMGDLKGRKKAMYYAMLGTSCATFAIGILPTYESVGLIAAVLFAFFRALQCFFLGGEYNGGAIYCLEHESNTHKYGLVSGLYCALTVVGIVLASLVAIIVNSLGPSYFRVAYGISFLLALCTYKIRSRIKETPEYSKIKIHHTQTISSSWLSSEFQYKFIAILIGSLFFGMLYGLPTRIFNALLPLAIGIDGHLIMILNTVFLVIYLILLIVSGMAADRFGIERVMRSAIGATIILTYPLIWLIETKSIMGLIIAKAVFAALTAGFIGPFHAWAQGFFQTQSRYQHISTAYAAGKCFSTLLLASTILFYERFESLSIIGLILIITATLTRRIFRGHSMQRTETLSYNQY